MNRREAIRARKEERKPKKLTESDYLLGVYDATRMGALRFSLEEGGWRLSPMYDVNPSIYVNSLSLAISRKMQLWILTWQLIQQSITILPQKKLGRL